MRTRGQQLLSIGRVAALVSASPAAIRDAAQAGRIVPPLILDDVPHFTDRQIERIRRHLDTHRRAPRVAPRRRG